MNSETSSKRKPDSGDDQSRATAPRTLRSRLAEVSSELDTAQGALRCEREEKLLLQNELQHRLRNLLAVVRSIFARSVAAGGSLEEVADHFRGRLDVLARYQLSQTSEPGGSADLETIFYDELHTARAADDTRISIKGRGVRLPFESALLVGLAIHELVTNSIKFGALSSSAARSRLAIGWRVTSGRLRMTWCESGVALVTEAPIRRGFGREFIEEALPYQLGAVTAFDVAPGQFTCRIEFALSEAGSTRMLRS